MWIWWVNVVHGGIKVGTITYNADFKWIDNMGIGEAVVNTTKFLLENESVQFMFGPYSSSLTPLAAAVTESKKVVMVTGGASATTVFDRSKYLFGTLSPASGYLSSALKTLILRGSRTIVTIVQQLPFSIAVGAGVTNLVATMQRYTNGLEIVYQVNIPATPTYQYIHSLIFNLTNNFSSIDILVGCVYFDACILIVQATESVNLVFRAMLLTNCVDNPAYTKTIGVDADEYILGAIQWSELFVNTDVYTGWTPKQFADIYRQRYFNTTPSYQAAAYFAAGLALTRALEEATSLDSIDVAYSLSRLYLNTFYGLLQFDTNGQITLDYSYVQYDSNGKLQVVIPDALATGSLIYPMPSFPYRRCILANGPSSCKCASVGCPLCTLNSYSFNVTSCQSEKNFRTIEFYRTIECELDHTFTPPQNIIIECDHVPYTSPPGVIVQAVAYFGALTGLCFFVWIIFHRKTKIIRASQPAFCAMICLGAMVCALSPIVSLGTNSSIKCQTLPWMFHCSFTLMMGSLFVKTYRVWRIFGNTRLTKIKLSTLESLKILAFITAVVVLILTIWYIQEVPQNIVFTYYIPNVGFVTGTACSKHSTFVNVLIFFEVALVAFACYFSFKNRKAPGNFSETQSIQVSVYSIAFIFGITRLVALQHVGESLHTALFGVGTSVSCIVSLFALFFPKIVQLYADSTSPVISTSHRRNSPPRSGLHGSITHCNNVQINYYEHVKSLLLQDTELPENVKQELITELKGLEIFKTVEICENEG